jgi:hypothetical protein
VSKKLPKEDRRILITEAVCNMDIEDVGALEIAIQGYDVKTIERQIGSMSGNQWRECLINSLENLILKGRK